MIKKISKIFVYLLWLFVMCWVWSTSYDLVISNITLANGWWNTISQWWQPDLLVMVKNQWDSIANLSNVPAGFITCLYKWNIIWKTNVLQELIIREWTEIGIWVSLKSLLTAVDTTKNIQCNLFYNGINLNTHEFSLNVSEWTNFNSSIQESIASIRDHLDAAEPQSIQWGGVSVKNFIFNLLSNVLVPIIVLAWVIMWIIWWYQVLTSDKPEKIKDWILKIVFGIVWIIIILSAKYIGTSIFDIFGGWDIWELDSIEMVTQLYEKIAYPFIKIAIYLSLWILFLILAGKTVSIVTSGDAKKAGTIILWTIVSIFTIIWAKQLVEAIYGKQNEVLNKTANNLWEIWTWLLADKNIPLVYDVINWVIWITSLLILILIIVHTFKILTNPDKADNWRSLWKSLLYIFIWIMVIWAGYLLTNVLIIN